MDEKVLTMPSEARPISEPSAAERLIVDLNLRKDAAFRLVDALGDLVSFYKVHWLFFLSANSEGVQQLLDRGKRVFLDFKFNDVPEVVGGAIRQLAEQGIDFVTLHGNGETVRAALEARKGTDLKLLVVSLLTHLSEDDMHEIFKVPPSITVQEFVIRVSNYWLDKGIDGIITSPQEVKALRETLPHTTLIVTPGIRMRGQSRDDHKRTGSPYQAIRDGADYLVVGKPIYQSEDPASSAEDFISEINRGLADR